MSMAGAFRRAPTLKKVLLWLALAPFGRGACPGADLNIRQLLSGSKDRFGRKAQVRESSDLPIARSSDELSLTDRFRGYGRPTSSPGMNGGFRKSRSLSPEISRSAISL